MAKKNLHIGSSFDDFLKETGDSAEVSPVAIKRVFAWQVSQKMEKENISKTDMAKLMDTSRSALDRLLDPTNTSVTLHTLDNAAKAIITLSCYEVCCHKDRLYSRSPAEVDSEDSLKQNGYKFRYSAQFAQISLN